MLSRLKTFLSTPGIGFRAPVRIFWVGFAVRVLYITLAHTYRVRTILDHFQFGWEVGRIARSLAIGHGYADLFYGPSGPTAWIPPLYPLILAGVFKLFGVYSPLSAWVILTINSIFSAGIALLVYEIAARCYDATSPGRPGGSLGEAGAGLSGTPYGTALWSAWLWALYPAAAQYAVHWIWDMSLTTFFFTGSLVLALRVRGIGTQTPNDTRHQTTGRWALFGLFWGAIGLLNPSLYSFLPFCGLWMLWPTLSNLHNFSRTAAKAALAGVLFATCLAPWTIRNWIVFHTFIPTRDNFGAELYQSTLLENNGYPWGPAIQISDATEEFLHYKQLGELAWVKERDTAARQNIRQHPDRILKWTIQRIYFFWVSVPHPFERHPSVEVIREVNFCLLSTTGILGLLLSLQRRIPASGLFATAFLVLPMVYYFVTVQARFRHPIEPLITIFSVFLFRSAERAKSRRPPEMAA